MSQLPAGTIGDAVGVLIFTFICLFTNIILILLQWSSRDRLGYVTLIAYFALICTISSIIQQIYNYSLWNDLMWAQLHYIQANYTNADVVFNNGNFGFMRVLANIRLFCYIMESSYLLTYSIQIFLIIRGHWLSYGRPERVFAIWSKIIPLLLACLTLGLLQTPPVQSSFVIYMVVANVQSVTSCVVSIAFIAMVIWEYINARRSWKRIASNSQSGRWRFGKKDSRRGNSDRLSQVIFDNSWLVFRLSMAILLVSAFIVASLVTHLPQREDVAKDAQATEPDLSPGRARSNISGYIFGVTPGLAIWTVFGLTASYRNIMYESIVHYWLRRKKSQSPSPPQERVDIELHMGKFNRSAQRGESRFTFRAETSSARIGAFPESTIVPLLEHR